MAPQNQSVPTQPKGDIFDQLEQNPDAPVDDALAGTSEGGGTRTTGQPSAIERFGRSYLSGAGVVSPEQGKSFFTHPIDTLWSGFERQGQLAQDARDALKRGDYWGAVTHGLNYLVPFIGQQTDVAGQQLQRGDIAGGIGTTLGVGTTIAGPKIASAAKEAAGAAAQGVADTAAPAVRAAARAANTGLQKMPTAMGTGIGAALGRATGLPGGTEVGAALGYGVGKELLPNLRVPGEGFGLPGRVTGGPGPGEVPAYQAPPPPPPPPFRYPGPGEIPPYQPRPLGYTAIPAEPIRPSSYWPQRLLPGEVPQSAALARGPEVTPTPQAAALDEIPQPRIATQPFSYPQAGDIRVPPYQPRPTAVSPGWSPIPPRPGLMLPPAPEPPPAPRIPAWQWGSSSPWPRETTAPSPTPPEPQPPTPGRTGPGYQPPAGPAQPTPEPSDADVERASSIERYGEGQYGRGLPNPPSGEIALRQILSNLDNKQLSQIAKARGLDVTAESQLKPHIGNARIANRIVDNFTPDELDSFRNHYIEFTRNQQILADRPGKGGLGAHDWGVTNKEAQQTLQFAQYFPELKIAKARVGRMETALGR